MTDGESPYLLPYCPAPRPPLSRTATLQETVPVQMTTDIIKLGHLDPNTDKSSPPVPTDISRVIFPRACFFI